MEVAQLLQGSKAIVKSGQELSQEEESALAQMTLQEAREKRKELAKLKVLQSYQEAKQKRWEINSRKNL